MDSYCSDNKPDHFFIKYFFVSHARTGSSYNLIGKWTIYNSDGTSIGEFVDLKADSTYTVTLPDGTIGERGSYLFKDPVFSIKNIKGVCGKGYWGKYKLTFVGADSIHFALIEDSCSARRMDIVGYNPGLRRYKAK